VLADQGHRCTDYAMSDQAGKAGRTRLAQCAYHRRMPIAARETYGHSGPILY